MKTAIIIKISLLIFSLLVVMSLGVAGAQAQDNRPRLRVINASLGVKNIDVYVGNTLFFRNVHYGQVTEYVPLDAREHELKVRPAGVKPVDPVTSLKFPFEADQDYTMVVNGTPEKVDVAPFMLRDDNKTPLPPGKTRIRYVDAALNAPSIEICVDEQCQILTYGQTSKGDVNDYISLDAGLYQITVRQLDAKVLEYEVLSIGFDSGEVYSIFVLDPTQGEVRLNIIPQADTGCALPGPPCTPGVPGPPGGGPVYPAPPIYPPVTGAFLSPTLLIFLLIVALMALAGSGWYIWRHLVKA